MKNKLYIKYFLILSLTAISILPLVNFYKYAKNYDFKQSFNTDSIESSINYLVYKLFNRSLYQEMVIAGKDKFLFLGNKDAKIVHKTTGVYRPSQEEIKDYVEKLKNIQNYYQNKNIPFIIVLAPDKSTIYKEKLPNWMVYDGKTITDDIVAQAKLQDINLLDLRQTLLDSKTDELLYWKTDSHWNEKGASIAFLSSINYLNAKHNLNLNIPNYDLIPIKENAKDLARLLKINNKLKNPYETSYNYKFEKEHDICIGDINKDSHTLEKCEKTHNQIIYTNFQPKYIINQNSVNNSKLLFICDSFAAALSPFYNAAFSTIYKFHWTQLTGEKIANFTDEYKPDIVVYQIVERAFFTFPQIVAPITQ